MTTVDAVLERQLPALEDLHESGILSRDELKRVIERRRDFEYMVQSRAPKKASFLRYVSFELNLEALRRLRKAKLGIKRQLTSDYAGVQHLHHVFHRALRRFGQDVGLWLQYLDFGMRTNSAKQLGSAFARALSRHPRVPALWLQAASWEFDRNRNVQAARTLMQRGLRVNQTSQQMWLEYFRLELLYVQKIKARRLVLGLESAAGGEAGGEGEDEDEGVAAVLNGAVLKTVFAAAVKAIPDDARFCQQFLDVLTQVHAASQPRSATALATRAKVLTTPPFSTLYNVVLDHLSSHFPRDADSWLLRARALTREAVDNVLQLAPVAQAASTAAARAGQASSTAPSRRKRRRVRSSSDASGRRSTPAVAAAEESAELTHARVALEKAEAAALALLSEGLQAVQGPALAEGFVEFCEEQLALPLADSEAQRERVQALRSIIVDTCARARGTGRSSAVVAVAWIKTLQRLGRTADARRAAVVACDDHAGSTAVWRCRADLEDRVCALSLPVVSAARDASRGASGAGAGAGAGAAASPSPAAEAIKSKYGAGDGVLAAALPVVAPRDALSLIGARLDRWLVAGRSARSASKSLSQPSGQTGSVSCENVSAELLDYAVATGGLRAARALYKRVLGTGAPLAAYLGALDMELAAMATGDVDNATTALVRSVCERAVTAFGVDSPAVWERYVEMERLAGAHDKAAAARWRAVHTLADPEAFLASQVVGSGALARAAR